MKPTYSQWCFTALRPSLAPKSWRTLPFEVMTRHMCVATMQTRVPSEDLIQNSGLVGITNMLIKNRFLMFGHITRRGIRASSTRKTKIIRHGLRMWRNFFFGGGLKPWKKIVGIELDGPSSETAKPLEEVSNYTQLWGLMPDMWSVKKSCKL